MSCCDSDFCLDCDGCFRCCDTRCKVKARFGLAWISESPCCPCPQPIGWQVEFCDTPSRVEMKCQEMVKWINCPPLPRCDPCPPEELCCGSPCRSCCTKSRKCCGSGCGSCCGSGGCCPR